MIIRLLISLLFFSLSRLQFLLFNAHYFSDLDGDAIMMAFLGGIRFDITAVIVLNSLYILMNVIPLPFRYKSYWKIPSNIIFYITNITGFALNSVDTVYFRFTSKRMYKRGPMHKKMMPMMNQKSRHVTRMALFLKPVIP